MLRWTSTLKTSLNTEQNMKLKQCSVLLTDTLVNLGHSCRHFLAQISVFNEKYVDYLMSFTVMQVLVNLYSAFMWSHPKRAQNAMLRLVTAKTNLFLPHDLVSKWYIGLGLGKRSIAVFVLVFTTWVLRPADYWLLLTYPTKQPVSVISRSTRWRL